MKTTIIHTFSYNYMCSIKTKEQIYIYILLQFEILFFFDLIIENFYFHKY